ncbi:MAG: 3-methyl-2-oxobutanoate hydroxymethyltransferase [Deltaproteobacteria bacterium]|nr:3-methyl-2-oxobutanoate hydroxymethyltransferase [Deltaproteobacteria bacterium]
MMNVHDFRRMKLEGRKISMVTCYDYSFAKILNSTDVDCLLVGDSVSMVMHGFPSTVHATTGMMEAHTAAVARGATNKFIVADMPFLSFRKGVASTLETVEKLMRAGAHAVKLEGVDGHEDGVSAIVGSGVPVMGHIGLTPQSIHGLGGFRVQGRGDESAKALLKQAEKLQELGCFSLVLECIPANLCAEITESLSIPTIGIGAGKNADGQVLVLQDLLGMNPGFKPKFLRHFSKSSTEVHGAINRFHHEVLERTFPSDEESYQ